MALKMIINPISNEEKNDIWTTLTILKEKSLLESYQRQLLFKAAKYHRWYIGIVPKFVETFIEIINLQDKEKIDKLVNFKDILTKINKEFIEKVKSLKQIVSLADTLFFREEEIYTTLAYDLYKFAEQKNSTEAIYQIGEYYYYGLAKNFMEFEYKEEHELRDYEKARIQFEKAAKKKHTGSLLNLGEIYTKGLGVEQDLELAAKYYETAYKKDNDYGLENVVKCLSMSLSQRLLELNDDNLTVHIKTKKDVEDIEKCKAYIKKYIDYLKNEFEDYYDQGLLYYELALGHALGCRFLPGGYKKNLKKVIRYQDDAYENGFETETYDQSLDDACFEISYLFQDETKISKQIFVMDNEGELNKKYTVEEKKIVKLHNFEEKKKNIFNDTWLDEHLKDGETSTIEFKPRIFFMDNGKSQYDQIQNMSIMKIAKIICAFLNSSDDDESYIFFGVLDDRSNKNIKGINEDINFYKKEKENEHVTKTIDRIIQHLSQKLSLLLGEAVVANYVKIRELVYKKNKRILFIRVKNSSEPVFFKFHKQTFNYAADYKTDKRNENITREKYIEGLFVRISADIKYFKGQELWNHIKKKKLVDSEFQ